MSTIVSLDNGLASIPFEITNNGYTLRDAIVGTPDYINSLSEEQIAQIQQTRFDNWYAVLTAAPDQTGV